MSHLAAVSGSGVDVTRDFTLAALALAWPGDELVEVFGALGQALSAHPGLGPLNARLVSGLDALRGEYLATFDTGAGRVPLYETEYGRMRALAKGRDLADVLGFYQAFGLDLSQEAGELPDHVAVELEFYALLLHKQALLVEDPVGTEIVLDARKKFLVEHLGGFVPAIATAVSPATNAVYGAALTWAADVVAAECRRLGVAPAPLDFFAGDDEGVSCGGCVEMPGLTQGTRAP